MSVLVPTFNRAPLLREALQSIAAQVPAPAQVVVVDDGSTDDTGDVARALDVQYVRQDNAGKAAALNRGLPLLTGDYVWIFDDDDIALPGFLARAVDRLDRDPALGFVYSSHLLGATDEHGNIVSTRPLPLPALDRGQAFLRLLAGYFFAQQGMLVRRDCFARVGPFNEALHRSQDYEMMIRLARAFPFAALPEPAFVLRQHGGPRGPQASRHAGDAQQRTRVHMDYDGKVGRLIRESIDLAEYVRGPGAAGPLDAPSQRLALLRRMGTMAGKGLLDAWAEDLARAARCTRAPLSDEERRACRDSIRHRYFSMRLHETYDAGVAAIAGLPHDAVGRALRVELAKAALSVASTADTPARRRLMIRFALAAARHALWPGVARAVPKARSTPE